MVISSTRLLSRKQSVSVLVEGTPGQAETTGFKCFPCYEISATPEIGFIERDLFTSSLAPEQTDAVGTQFARVTFKVDAMGAGAGTRPQWTEALFGCGMRLASQNSVSAGTFDGDGAGTEWNIFVPENVPAQANSAITEFSHVCKTVTVKWWSDGRIYTLAGAAGNVSFSGTAGDLCYANFELLGILTVAVGTDPSTAFDSVTPQAISQDNSTYFALYEDDDNDPTTRMSSWELNMNNSYDIYKDINVVKAGRFCSITERKPTLTTTTLAFDGDVGDLLISSMLDVDTGSTTGGYWQQQVGPISGSNYDGLWFGCQKGQITSLDTGDENGYMTESATSKLIAGGSSDDNLPTDREFYLAYGADLQTGVTMNALNFSTLSLT